MARPRSNDKHKAILAAAAAMLAERGLSAAPTSEISRRAGIAEGTLFTYFKTKDDLVNALYQQIRLELAHVIMAEFPRRKKLRRRLRHLWNGYIRWGVAHPVERKVLSQLEGSDLLTPESRLTGSAPFMEVQALVREAMEQQIVRPSLSTEFIGRVFNALAVTTTESIVSYPANLDEMLASGFKLLWNGITRK